MVSKDGWYQEILLINPDREVIRFWEEKLSVEAYLVTPARSVEYALRLMQKRCFVLALYIFEFPSLDDMTALRKLKEKQPELKLIACGCVRSKTINKYLTKAEADAILHQTARAPDIIHTIDAVLGNTNRSELPSSLISPPLIHHKRKSALRLEV